MTDPTIASWSRENDLLFQLRQLREENDCYGDGNVYRGVRSRDSESNTFKPDWSTESVLVEEMQRMAKRIEELEKLLTRQTARIVDLQTHIENLAGES